MNEKWFSIDISEIEKKLKTNAASGLSPRAARSRRTKSGRGFFITPRRSFGSMVLDIFSDFALVLLIISSVVALCFEEYAMGVGILVTVMVNVVVTSLLYFRSQRLFESLETFFHPSVTVIRGGRAYSVDSESVVPGDIVLLTAGDVLSFDARLITSDKLKVAVRVDRDTVVECEKLAHGVVRDKEYDIRNMPNMLHAGSVIKEGSARAVVTATGRYTYYGAMTGGVVLKPSHVVPRGLLALKKYCSAFGFALMLAILPFSALCLLFSHDKVTLLTVFTSVLAIAASSMAGISCTACRVFFEKQARQTLVGKDPAAVRSEDVMDRLLGAEYVFLLDGSATCDGVLHLEGALCAEGGATDKDSINASVSTLGELAALYDSAESRVLTMGIHSPGRYSTALSEFIEETKTDAEALKIRCTVTGYLPGNLTDKTDKLFYLDGDIRYILNVCSSADAVDGCNRCVIGGEISSFSDEEKGKISAELLKCHRRGKQMLVFTLSDNVAADVDGKSIFAGALILSQKNDSGLGRAASALALRGVKTISFVNIRKESFDNRSEIPSPMMATSASLFDFEKAGLPITHKFGSISTYVGLSAEHIDKLIEYAHSINKRVAVVCFTDFYKKLRKKPDLFVTSSELQYRFTGRFEEKIEAIEVSGDAESLSCRQDIKSDADLMIPRPSKNGGGLSSLLEAVGSAQTVYANLSGFFKYLLCTQFVRIFMVLLPMLFGEAHLDARHALFCGFIIDLFALVAFAFERYSGNSFGYIKRIEDEFFAPLRSNFGMIAAASSGALCAVILPHIVGAMDFMGRYLYETEYLFVSMLLLHLGIMYCIRLSNSRKYGSAKRNVFAIALSVFALVFLLVCFAVRPVGALFYVVDISLPYLIMTLVPLAVFLLLYAVIGKLGIVEDK